MEYSIVYQYQTDTWTGEYRSTAAINAKNAEAFQQKVNQKLSEGFQLHGSVSTGIDSSGCMHFTQALYK